VATLQLVGQVEAGRELVRLEQERQVMKVVTHQLKATKVEMLVALLILELQVAVVQVRLAETVLEALMEMEE
jgi:hypothetical protein